MRRVRQYEAFISYSHESDSAFAARLQQALNRIARPAYKWWHWWPPRVFRDQTNLAAASDLGAEIKGALLGSDSFVLLASPGAAASAWVDREVATWCANKPPSRLFIALTDGTLAWDNARGDFDPARTNALPPALTGVFDAEPLWVDFTGVREHQAAARDLGFMDGVATLAAAIRGIEKDALVGEDARQHRRTRQLVGSAIGMLTVLSVLASVAAIYAFVQRNHANERARLATSRQLAAESVAALGFDPEQSLALAARAATTAPTNEAVNALRQALRGSRLRTIIDAGAQVFDAELDPTGRVIAAALADGTVRTWNARTGKPIVTLRLARAPVRNVSFSRDGGRLLGAGDAGAAVWSTSPDTRRPLATFGGKGRPLSAALSPDGQLVATGGIDGIVRLWRAETGVLEENLTLPVERSPVTGVAFSADGARLVAASGVHTAVWRLHTKSSPILQSHEKDVWAVAFGPDGRHVATGDVDGVARVWSLDTGSPVELNGHEGAITSLAFSRDGMSLVTASEDETGRIWDAETGRSLAELRGHQELVLSATFAPDGKTVVTGGRDGTIRAWASASDPVLVRLTARNKQPLRDVGFHPRGELIVTAGEDRTARVWALENGRVMHVLRHGQGRDEWVESAQFSPDGQIVLTAGDDGTAKVWDSSSGALLASLGQRGDAPLYDAAISSDGRMVAAGGGGPTVRVWRWRQRKLVLELGGFVDRVDGVAFSHDGALLAGAGDKTVRVWRVADGSTVAVLPRRNGRDQVTSVAFDPSGELVAAGGSNGSVALWNVRTMSRTAWLPAHGDAVTSVGFSADGRYLLTVGHDGMANVWTVPDGHPVTAVRTRASSLEGGTFSPRGRGVAVAGAGGWVTVFECTECRPLRSLVCLAQSRVTPRVRARERDAFATCD